uniref:Photosystem II reaction center protein Z n=1 Tax=Pseudellipsoidion edaphicum TaxID=1431838 RepID=A0A3R5U566_9STRA|nr:photosystem II protein Z [Pseudellipsoidion edaphicum]QAA11966.1 photosystem II protein Z [Pseudellipsoidion edaphicum]
MASLVQILTLLFVFFLLLLIIAIIVLFLSGDEWTKSKGVDYQVCRFYRDDLFL